MAAQVCRELSGTQSEICQPLCSVFAGYCQCCDGHLLSPGLGYPSLPPLSLYLFGAMLRHIVRSTCLSLHPGPMLADTGLLESILLQSSDAQLSQGKGEEGTTVIEGAASRPEPSLPAHHRHPDSQHHHHNYDSPLRPSLDSFSSRICKGKEDTRSSKSKGPSCVVQYIWAALLSH